MVTLERNRNQLVRITLPVSENAMYHDVVRMLQTMRCQVRERSRIVVLDDLFACVVLELATHTPYKIPFINDSGAQFRVVEAPYGNVTFSIRRWNM